jgi:hypothetical protein
MCKHIEYKYNLSISALRKILQPLRNVVILLTFLMVSLQTNATGVVAQGADVEYIKVKTDEGISKFHQTKPLYWSNSQGMATGDFLETLRTGSLLELTDLKGDRALQFNFDTKKIRFTNAATSRWVDAGDIELALAANGKTLKGVSVIVQAPSKIQEIHLDETFTNNGSPSGWIRQVYEAPGIPNGSKMPMTKGNNVERVVMANGNILIRFKDRNMWGEFGPRLDMEPLASPLRTFSESRRDEWSVYLEGGGVKFGLDGKVIGIDSGSLVQIDLYQKIVKYDDRSMSSPTTTTSHQHQILPEKFPGFGQFSRTIFDTTSDAKRGITKELETFTFDDVKVSIGEYGFTCRNRYYPYCKVLRGEDKPRSITGRSVGSLQMTFKNSNANFNYDVILFGQNYGSFSVTQVSNNVSLAPWIVTNRTRSTIDFWANSKVGTLDLNTKLLLPTKGMEQYVAVGEPISFLRNYYPEQFKAFIPVPKPGIGPGFEVTNKSDWPVLVSIDQVGCLYHGIVEPGDTYKVNTGAVWFTVKTSIAPVLEEPTDWDCAIKPLVMIGSTAIAGLVTGITGGAAGVPMAMALAAVSSGVMYGSEAAFSADGMSLQDAQDASMVVGIFTGLATGGTQAFFSGTAKISALKYGTSEALEIAISASTAALGQAISRKVRFLVSEVEDGDLDTLEEQLTQVDSLAGVYAGHTWPYSDADRKRTSLVVTGGPTKETLEDGIIRYDLQKTPLTLKLIK